MSDSIIPESRIFRIGRECYIVYLGKERDDFRPFLRIGNSRDIPDEVHEVTSTTVVTDDHVGNPLIEILLAPKFHGRYLGDTAVVASIRRFFKSFDLPTDDVTDYRKVKDGERRHMVWFYSSGNIHLRYDERVIFDLHNREKEDRHFVRLYEEAKKEFLRNPLRYIKQDFSGQGIVLSGGNGFWYEAGELLSFAAHPGFVAGLMGQGVDPDFISTSAYNLTPDQMDSHDAAVFVGFIKRMRQRRKQLRVITSSPELQRKLKLLFPARGDVPATLEVTDVSGKRKATFRDSIISRREEKWFLHRAGLPEMVFGAELEKGLSIDIDKRRITYRSDSVQKSFTLPEGFPVEFIGHEVPENQLMDKYLSYTLSNVKDHLSPGELQAVTALERYLRMFREDISAKKTSVSPLLKQVGNSCRDALRHCRPAQGGPSWFFFINAHSILDYLGTRIESDHGLMKSCLNMSSALDTFIEKLSPPDSVLPFWGDLYFGKEPVFLWRASKRGFVPADIVSSHDIEGNINNIARLDETPWNEDKERLLRLIRSLGQGGQGPLTEEQIAILGRPEEQERDRRPEVEKTEKRVSPEISVSRVSGKPDSENESSGSEIAGKADKTKKTGRSRGRGWIWILLLLLILLAGLTILDLSGTAPWGSILKSESKSEHLVAGTGTGRESSEIQDQGTGRETAAGDETGTSVSADSQSSDEKSEADTGSGTGAETSADEKGSTESASSTSSTSTSTTTSSSPSSSEKVSDETVDSGSSPDVVVDADVAPTNSEEVKAYLDVGGRIAITEVDIHLAANEIAVLNGYKDLDYKVFTGNDPNWIYPGSKLVMPGSGDYTIKAGDTIWFLAAREVRVDAEKNMEIFDQSVSILDSESSGREEKKKAEENLRLIAEKSRAAALRESAQEALLSRNL